MSPISRIASVVRISLMVALAAAGWAGAAAGQQGASMAPPPSAASDSLLPIVPPRPLDEIRTDIGRAADDVLAAQAARTRVTQLRDEADAQIEAKKREVNALGARIDVANHEKREADKTSLEAQKRSAELVIDLLERRKSLWSQEMDAARAAEGRAVAAQKAYNLELELASRREERTNQSAGATMIDRARFDQVIGELEQRTLEAEREVADRAKDVADRNKTVIDRRLDLLKAQQKLTGPAS